MIVLVHNEQAQKSLDVTLDYMWHVIQENEERYMIYKKTKKGIRSLYVM